MSDEHIEEHDAPVSLKTKVISSLVLLVALLGVVFFLMRVGSPAIPASRPAPAGHYALPCAICHVMTEATSTVGTP
jgi:hypothetical protein